MTYLSNQEINQLLLPYGAGTTTPALTEGISCYMSLLLQWNRTISLTTVTDPNEIVKFHFGESLFASQAVPIYEGRLADVGSGAGFPGLPLRMASSKIDLTLIESNARKAAFLSEVARDLHLGRVEVFRGRMENCNSGQFDFITARALGHHNDLLAWAKKHLNQTGEIVLWLGEGDAGSISRESEWNWREPIHIPVSRGRYLLVGSPRG